MESYKKIWKNPNIFVNKPKYAHFSYLRYIENRLRSSFNLDGTYVDKLTTYEEFIGE